MGSINKLNETPLAQIKEKKMKKKLENMKGTHHES
jgi:hypothetical protein